MSKPVVVNIPHELGRAEARRRIDEGVGRLTSQIGAVGELQKAWEGDTLAFSLQAIGQKRRPPVESRRYSVSLVEPMKTHWRGNSEARRA